MEILVPTLILLAALAALVWALARGPLAGLRRWGFARFYDRMQAAYEDAMAERREALVSRLRGTVLEIGPGTGASLPYLHPEVRWIGAEPNPHMRARLRARAEELGRAVEFREIAAVADGEADGVLSTLTLCSIDEPDRLLAEIRRVLAPGGRFWFLEHVAAPEGSRLRRRQRRIRPFWKFFADGCRPDRESIRLIREAGFTDLVYEAFDAPPEACLSFVAPHVAGSARGS